MRFKQLKLDTGFRVAFDLNKVQAAEMVIEPGGSEGGPENRHKGADQWLFVISGSGIGVVEGRPHKLRAGSLLLIERGERHEIRNVGRRSLKTLNFYSPPAYDAEEEPLAAGRN